MQEILTSSAMPIPLLMDEERERATLSRLIQYYGLESEAERLNALFDLISRESLPGFYRSHARHFSAINGNGMPIQFSVSLGTAMPSLRYLGEVGSPGMSIPERLQLTTFRLREILRLLDLQSASTGINHLFELLFPKNPDEVKCWTCGIWIAFRAVPGHPIGLRLYLNQRWGSILERYYRIGHVFASLGREHSLVDWCRVAEHVSTCAIPFGVAFDIVPEGVSRFKVYFAAHGVNWKYLENLLACLGFCHRLNYLKRLITLCDLDQPGIPPWAIMPSLEFSDHPGCSVGLKLDVSCNHLHTSDAQMDTLIMNYLQEFSFDPEEYQSVLGLLSLGTLNENKVERIQYCGIGFQEDGSIRFNIYFCPGSVSEGEGSAL